MKIFILIQLPEIHGAETVTFFATVLVMRA